MGLARAGGVEEPAVHEEDGELGEEDGGAVEHFGGVCELGAVSVWSRMIGCE